MRCCFRALRCAVSLAWLLPAIASAGEYFVAPDGVDTDAGDASRPLRTIAEAVSRARPGDTVMVTPGAYGESVVISRSGDAAAPIVVRALPGAVLTCPEPWSGRSAIDIREDVAHIVVQGFELDGGFGETVFVRPGAHDIELSGLNIHGNQTGIWIAGAHHVTIRDSQVHGNAGVGVRLCAGAHDVQVLDTGSHDNDDGRGCEGDADGFSADETTAAVRFERVEASGNSEDGFDLQTPNVEVARAIARHNGCSGFKMWAGGYLQNALIEGHRLGINTRAPPGSLTTVQNCTVVDNALGMRVLGGDHTVAVQNSIITGPAKALSYAATVWLRERYNILHRPLLKDALIVRMGPENEWRYSGNDINDGIWQAESGQGEETMADDPLLDPLTRQPQPESAAIDSGSAAASPATDLAGVPRPVGAATDRGAFECVPVEPSLRLQRAVLHTHADGSGRLHIRAQVIAPPVPRLDPPVDAVRLSLRGEGDGLLEATATTRDWGRRGAARSPCLRTTRIDAGGRRVCLRLRQVGPDRLLLSLRARGADLSVLSGDTITLALDVGGVQLTSTASLKHIERRSSPR